MRFTPVFFALALAPCLLAQNGDRPGDPQTPLPSHLKAPPAPPLSPEEALKTFKLPPGLKIELVAADPLVLDPVAMTIGPDGRIWVAEMRGYMPNADGLGEDAANGVIAVLSDTDGDGRMDKRTVFAEGLVLPRAVAVVGDGVLVAEPPRLWFMRDTDGDGRADKKTVVAEDYGNRVNPEQSANGLLRGLDNWIYSANHNARYRRQSDGTWKSEPTAFRGQFGIAQDDIGRLYFNVNETPLRADQLPAEYIRRNRNIPSPRSVNADLAKPTAITLWPARLNTGVNRGYKVLRPDGTLPNFTAGCGLTIYRGSLLPSEYYGDAFVCEPAANLVKRLHVADHDGLLSATNVYPDREFLTSTDERFRPVNLVNGPDGALYIVDFYRGLIQHRLFLTTFLRKQVEERGLESPRALGRIYRIVPESRPRPAVVALNKASVEQLVAALSHADAWQRETAQRLLVDRRDPAAAELLRRAATSAGNPLGRLHSLWTLEGLNALDRPTLDRALVDTDARIATAAVRLSEPFFARDPQRVAAIAAAALKREPVVQRQLALSLGAAPFEVALPLLVRIAREAGSFSLMTEAILSSVAGHEQELIDALAGNPTPASAADSNTGPVLTLAKTVLQRSRAAVAKETALAPLTDAQQAALETGRQAYALCASCHQFDGKGMAGVVPPLAGSAWATGSPEAVIRIVLNGKKDDKLQMPPLHSLDDTTIAGVLTHVRRSWGNAANAIDVEQVRAVRAAVGSREAPWTDAELAPFAESAKTGKAERKKKTKAD